MSDESGFTKVQYRRKKPTSKSFTSGASNIHHFLNTSEETSINKEKSTARILQYKEELLTSHFYNSFRKSIAKVIKETGCTQIDSLVSLGLGRIGHCCISQYQLGLLLNVCDDYNIPKTLIHDPIFSNVECKILQNLGLDVVFENEEGKYQVSCKGLTIIYMPHCPKQLVNNFLWKNWGTQLQNCVIIGNSFSQIIETNTNQCLKEQASYITNVFPYVVEYKLENNFKFTDIFNDTSIHLFSKERISHILPEFWENNSEPIYSNNDTEYITTTLKSKLEIN